MLCKRAYNRKNPSKQIVNLKFLQRIKFKDMLCVWNMMLHRKRRHIFGFAFFFHLVTCLLNFMIFTFLYVSWKHVVTECYVYNMICALCVNFRLENFFSFQIHHIFLKYKNITMSHHETYINLNCIN